MSLEDSMAEMLRRNREARALHVSRFSQLVQSITKGESYEFDPYPDFGANTSGESGEVPRQEGETGIVGGNDSGEGVGIRAEATGTESVS